MTKSRRERVASVDLVKPGSYVQDAVLKVHPVTGNAADLKQVNMVRIEKEVTKKVMEDFTESMERALIEGKAVDFGAFKVEVYDSQAVKGPAGKKLRLVIRKRFKDTLNQ